MKYLIQLKYWGRHRNFGFEAVWSTQHIGACNVEAHRPVSLHTRYYQICGYIAPQVVDLGTRGPRDKWDNTSSSANDIVFTRKQINLCNFFIIIWWTFCQFVWMTHKACFGKWFTRTSITRRTQMNSCQSNLHHAISAVLDSYKLTRVYSYELIPDSVRIRVSIADVFIV